jgi:hypothetical protein
MSIPTQSKIAPNRYLGGSLNPLNALARLFGYLLRRDHAPAIRGNIL